MVMMISEELVEMESEEEEEREEEQDLERGRERDLEWERERDLEREREREWDLEREWERDLEREWKWEGSSIVGVTGRLGIRIESKESESTGEGNAVGWGSEVSPWSGVTSVVSVALGWDLVRGLVVGVTDRSRDVW